MARKAKPQTIEADERRANTTPEMARPKEPVDPDEVLMMLPEPGTAPPPRGPVRDRAFGKLQPPAHGLALIVGLAIGSPEFQRR